MSRARARTSVSSTHLLLPSAFWRNAELYLGYSERGPTSGLKPPRMKEALGPNMELKLKLELEVT